MHPFSMLLLRLAMSTDAFAAAIGKGAALQRPSFLEALRTGVIGKRAEIVGGAILMVIGTTILVQHLQDAANA